MAEESGGEGWWGAWGNEFLSNVKAKSAETISLVRQDLTEFVTTIQHDTTVTVAETASTVKEKLKVDEDDTDSSTTAVIRQGVSNWLGSLSTALQENISQITTVVDEEPSHLRSEQVFDRAQACLHEIQRDPATYCNEPDGHPVHFGDWCEGFDLEQHKGEISELLVNIPEIRSLYTKLVPSAVTHSLFWTRYFYKIYRLNQEEKRRAALVERANKMEEEDIGWDDEEESSDIEEHSQGSTTSKTVDPIETGSVTENELNMKLKNEEMGLKKEDDTLDISNEIKTEVTQCSGNDAAIPTATATGPCLDDKHGILMTDPESFHQSTVTEHKPALQPDSEVITGDCDGPIQSSTPQPSVGEECLGCTEQDQSLSNGEGDSEVKEDMKRENSSNSSVDSSWSKISDEEIKQTWNKKTSKDLLGASKHVEGSSPSLSEHSSSSVVIVPSVDDKDVDIDWDDDDDDLGDDVATDDVTNKTDSTTDHIKVTKADNDDDDWENWE